jgi:hypothetical protein
MQGRGTLHDSARAVVRSAAGCTPLPLFDLIVYSSLMGTGRLKEFFSPMVRRAFWELGLGEREIIDYVSDVLSGFARADNLYRLRSIQGNAIDSVVEMLSEAMVMPAGRSRIEWERGVRKYIGDYTLFMSGLFRSYVRRGGYLDYYLEEGRRAYWAVSELDLSLYRTGFLLFQELSKNFEFYSGALDYLRKAYFAPSPGEDPFAGFLRQIEGWRRISISSN